MSDQKDLLFVCANPACRAVYEVDPHTCGRCNYQWSVYPWVRATKYVDGTWQAASIKLEEQQ
jgi:hypothetical protein